MDYAVFDDCHILHTPGWKSWFGAQPYVGVRALYKDAQYIKWGKPIIWNCNRDPRMDMQASVNKEDGKFWSDDIDWINDNCIFIHVDEAIATFHANIE